MANIRGVVASGFEAVEDAFSQNFDEELELGAGFAAWIDDECIVDLQGGWADRRKTEHWNDKTLVPVFSTTKAISALSFAFSLFQRFPDDEDPYAITVGEVWPEFRAAGKDSITIGQILSHQAGLPGFKDAIDPELWLQPSRMAEKLAEERPMWRPGDRSGYHPLTWGYLVGELAQRLSGKSIGQTLISEFTNADGRHANRDIIDFWLGTPEREHHRIAEMRRPTSAPDLGDINEFRTVAFLTKWAEPKRGGEEWRTLEIPSANGHGTARSIAKLFSVYATGGRLGGNQLFTAEQFKTMTRRRTLSEDRVLPFTMEFGAGMMRNNNRIYGPNTETLGHAGWGGSCGFGDPDRQLSVAYVMNKQSNKLQTDERAQRLIAALYGCL